MSLMPLARFARCLRSRFRGFPAEAETGSESVEYALVIMVAATIAGVALTWARHGAVVALLDSVLTRVRGLFGIG
jgi:hypothetical protein